MIAQFMDTAAGTAVYINPTYVVTLRPDPADPDHVSIPMLRNEDSKARPECQGERSRNLRNKAMTHKEIGPWITLLSRV